MKISEGVIIPETPKMIANEQNVLYAPIASTINYGMVKIGQNSAKYFNIKDGILTLNADEFVGLVTPYVSDAKKAAEDAAESAEAAQDDTIKSITVDEEGHMTFEFYSGRILMTDSVKGPKPIKGKDYFTEQDINYMLAQLSFRTEDVVKIGEGYNSALLCGALEASADYSLAIGYGSKSISKSSFSVGNDVCSGTKAFYIEAIDSVNKKIYLRTDSTNGVAVIPSTAAKQGSGTVKSDFETGYSVGDEFSVINGTHYAFCGRISSINGNVLTYETKLLFTSNFDSNKNFTSIYQTSYVTISEKFSKIATDVLPSDYWREYIFWVPSKPECGFIISNGFGEEYFQGAQGFGDLIRSSANAAFSAGSENISGGKGAINLGTRNRAGYAALTTGGDNISLGLHGATIGRNLFNSTNYSVLTGRHHIALGNGQGHFFAGFGHVLESGSYVTLLGYNNKSLSGSYKLIAGRYNDYLEDSVFQVGYGLSDSQRQNIYSMTNQGDSVQKGSARAKDFVKNSDLSWWFKNFYQFNNNSSYVTDKPDGSFEWTGSAAVLSVSAGTEGWLQRSVSTGFVHNLEYKYLAIEYNTHSEFVPNLVWRSLTNKNTNYTFPTADGYSNTLIADGEWHKIIYYFNDSRYDSDGSDLTLLRWRFPASNTLTGDVAIRHFGLYKTLEDAENLGENISTESWTLHKIEELLLKGTW